MEDASRVITSNSEPYLVECSENIEKSYRSCLHIIAAMSETEGATRLCKQFLEAINNTVNRECLLNMSTVERFEMGHGRTVIALARVAAIHIAAYSGNLGVVRLLCQEYGVDVNCSFSETLEEKAKTGITPLEWAARNGRTEVVKLLLDNRADVNARRHTGGVTPLYVAAQDGHTEVVKLLLDHKAEVNTCCNDDGATPLYIADQNGHRQVVQLLLDYNADWNASRTDEGTLTPSVTAHKVHIGSDVKTHVSNRETKTWHEVLKSMTKTKFSFSKVMTKTLMNRTKKILKSRVRKPYSIPMIIQK